MNSRRFKLYCSYSSSFNLTNFYEFFWIRHLRDCISVFKLAKKKTNLPRKLATRKFHVVIVQRRQRNERKRRAARANLFFCESQTIVFLPSSLPSPSFVLILLIILISPLCYNHHGHGTVSNIYYLVKILYVHARVPHILFSLLFYFCML